MPNSRRSIFFLLLLCLVLTLSSAAVADQNYYTDFIKGKKELGFEPGAKFNQEIYWYIQNKYPTTVEDETLFGGSKKELKKLLSAYGLDPRGVNSLPDSPRILVEFLQKYKDKVSRSLAIYATGRGMVKSLNDPESEIILPSQSTNPRRDMIPEGYGGVGILIEERNSKVVIIQPFKNGPSQKAGIKPGDQLISINGVPVDRMDLDTITKKLRGEIGTRVKLKLKRGSKTFYRTLTRSNVDVNPVTAGLLMGGKIGYVKVVFFGDKYPRRVYDALQQFKKQGVNKWILDLRDNAGGALNNLITMASLFVPPRKPIMFIQYKSDRKKFTSAAKRNLQPPAAILVNNYTIGSAEILAAVLSEYGNSTIMGARTRGNTAVAELLKLTGGATLKLTVGMIQTGKKQNLHQRGITPDVVIPGANNPANQMGVLKKAIENLK